MGFEDMEVNSMSYKSNVSYDAGLKCWYVRKGTPAFIWKDGPLKERVVYEIETTHFHIFDRFAVLHSRKEYLLVIKKNQDDELWFMKVMK